MYGKQRYALNGYYRADIRIAISVFLLLYTFIAWKQRSGLLYGLDNAENALGILQQMQDYAGNVCPQRNGKPKVDTVKDVEFVKFIKHEVVTKESVDQELTFILMGPTLRCLGGKTKWIRSKYKKAKIIMALDVRMSVINVQNWSDSVAAEATYLLGGFNNRAEILNRAIDLISTKYFIIFDHTIDLDKTQSDFVEALLSNMPGFDVLSGSEVDLHGVFTIPCYRLKLRNWTFYETYEYNNTGKVLGCDSTSLFFLGRTEPFKVLANKPIFDTSLPSKWLQDFFIFFQAILDVGVVPEIVIRRRVPDNCYHVLPPVLSLSQRVDLLLPFVNKHQIFYFDNGTDHLSVCKHSQRMICSELDIDQNWFFSKRSLAGITTFPFIIESLKEALHYGTRCLEESNLLYVLEGGTLLGLVKLRDILPWDHGDIDTFVYSTRREVINMVKKTQREDKYHYWLRHSGFHTYVSNPPSALNGCVVYLTRRVKPKGIIYFRHSGKLFPINSQVFRFLREFYGSLYLESHMKSSDVRSYCEINGHHACMPDCRWDGCGGGRGAFPGIL